MDNEESRLSLLFRRAGSLPELPTVAVSVIRLIDGGRASAKDLEKLIAQDPGLCTFFLRTASVRATERADQTSIRADIMRMGQRSVRSLAVSLVMMKLLPSNNKYISQERLSRHVLFTALIARYLFARKQALTPFDAECTADEVFAAGMIHELGLLLLAKVQPVLFSRAFLFAKASGISIGTAFEKIQVENLSRLGSIAAETWALPKFFIEVLQSLEAPWTSESEFDALCCLNYADYLATTNGASVTPWATRPSLPPEVPMEVGVPEEELDSLVRLVDSEIQVYRGLVPLNQRGVTQEKPGFTLSPP